MGYSEIPILQTLKNLQVDFPTTAGTPRPVREMANANSKEIDRENANSHPFRPYVIHNYRERPWLPRITARANAFDNCESKTKGRKTSYIAPNAITPSHPIYRAR